MNRQELDHELAVLRPKPGDVVILYVDMLSIQDVDGTYRFLRQIRSDGIRVGILPIDCVVRSYSTEMEVHEQLDNWLRPFGYRAIRRED